MTYTIKFLNGTTKEFESLRGADLARADFRYANLVGAKLEEADLEGADLYGAKLEEANLVGANFRGANLRGVDLEGANLRRADLTFCKSIISFTLGKHFGFMVLDSKYVQIGCEGHDLDHWLENYEQIGLKSAYSKEDIRAYGLQLNMLNQLVTGE